MSMVLIATFSRWRKTNQNLKTSLHNFWRLRTWMQHTRQWCWPYFQRAVTVIPTNLHACYSNQKTLCCIFKNRHPYVIHHPLKHISISLQLSVIILPTGVDGTHMTSPALFICHWVTITCHCTTWIKERGYSIFAVGHSHFDFWPTFSIWKEGFHLQ